MFKLRILCVSLWIVSVIAQYEDNRCFCICPTIDAVFNNIQSKEKQYFKASLPASKCNCHGLIIPKLSEVLKGRETHFCHRCECKFEKRNTTVIMVVVVLLLWLLTLLSVYMTFLFCLDPLINFKRNKLCPSNLTEESQNLLCSNNDEADD